MTAEAAIWTPELWTPGIGWRPKPLPKFSLRTWRKAKEDALTQAATVSQSGSATTTTASAATVTITAPSASDAIVTMWLASGSSAQTANANAPVHTGSTFALVDTQLYTTATGMMEIRISTTTGTGTTVSQTPATAAGGVLIVFVCQNLNNISGVQAFGAGNSNAEATTSPQNSGNITPSGTSWLLFGVSYSRQLQSPGVVWTAPGGSWTTPISVGTTTTVQGHTASYQAASGAGNTYSISQAFTNSGVAQNVRTAIWALKEAAAATARPTVRRMGFAAVQGMARR